MELFSLLPTVNFSLLLPPLLLFLILFYHQTLTETLSNIVNTCRQLVTLVQLLRNIHRFLDWSTELLAKSPTHTAIIRTPLLVTAVNTANPLNVEHMLKTNFENYPKGPLAISVLEDFLGRGIFNSDGEHWRRQRKSASLEFSKRSLRSFVMHVVDAEIVTRLLPLLAKAAGENDKVVDLQDVFERFAFDNICKLALGEDPAALYGAPAGDTTVPKDFMTAFADAQNLIVNRFMDALSVTWKIKRLLNVGSEKKLKQSAATVHEFTGRIAKLRRERPPSSDRSDLLSRFASDEDNTEEMLRDIAVSFILAGRETTSSALTWFFWLLSSRPDVEAAILEETRSVRERNRNFEGATFSFDELREMNYLHAAITEAMRLYPPVPNDTHSCLKDDVMPDGTFVGRGWFVSYSAYAMGRMEDIWGEDCRDYKPERWLKDGAFQPENPYKYPVFHAGPRMCLGKEMAYIQMKSIAASMLERFHISVMLDKEKAPEQLLILTLRMKGGLPVRVREREREREKDVSKLRTV